jgi:hypothetical protein
VKIAALYDHHHHHHQPDAPFLTQIVRYLVENGANVNAGNEHNGYTALHLASGHTSVDVVRLLLASGGDPRIKDDYENTPLMKVRRRRGGRFRGRGLRGMMMMMVTMTILVVIMTTPSVMRYASHVDESCPAVRRRRWRGKRASPRACSTVPTARRS